MRAMTRRFLFLVVPGVLLGATTLSVPATRPMAAAAATPAIAFEVPRVSDPIHTYGEPDIGVAPNQATYVAQPSDQTSGEVYVSGPTGTGTQRSIWQGSVDGGHTFRTVKRAVGPLPITPCDIAIALAPVCGSISAPGGGDTEISFDHNRKQYFADLYALACQHTATRSLNSNGTENVADSPTGGCPVPGSDRQWILVHDAAVEYGPPAGNPAPSGPVIYMESNTVGAVACGPGSAAWYRSTDGLNYVNAEPGQPGGVLATYCPFGADGYPSIDQSTGKVFQAEFGSISGQPVIELNIGTPVNAAGDLCFLDHSKGNYILSADACANAANGPNVNKLVTVAANDPTLHDVVSDATEAANFVVTSMDRGRNLWVAWVNHAASPAQHQAWVSVASASSGWTQWSRPVQVSRPPSRVSIFPWIQAGDAGRADVVWYGDATSATPSSAAVSHVWDVYMSQVVFPLRSIASGTVNVGASPTVAQVKVTPHPMDLTDVCLLGTACVTALGNRNLADFFEVRTDNTGAAMIVYDDMSNGYCQPIGGCPAVQGSDHAGAPVVTVARQSSGPGLYADAAGQPRLVSGPSNAPVDGLADAPGDARFPLFGGPNVPQLDIVDQRISVTGQTMMITTRLAGDPRIAAATAAAGCPNCHLQLVTRWQMGTHLYYGLVEDGPTTGLGFFAGETRTIDDCSVSACDPHMLTYPEAPPFGASGSTESGNIECPVTPSAANPCKVIERIDLSHVGSPTSASLLEEIGAYGFVSQLPQGAITQANERADSGATEIDGLCCYNFRVAGASVVPGTPAPGSSPTAGPAQLPNTAAIITRLPLLAPVAFTMLIGIAVGAAEARRRRRPGTGE
jgi:hypothetical protein